MMVDTQWVTTDVLNIPKLGLGICTLGLDGVMMVQQYCLYGTKGER